MDRAAWLPRGAWSAVVVCVLASLVFLGSPGCGCGDDNLIPRRGGTPRCCCTYEWLPPRDLDSSTVVISLFDADPSLQAAALPSVLTGVTPLEPVTFQVCVNADHDLGAQLTLVIQDQGGTGAREYGRVLLLYKSQCRGDIEPLTGDLDLISPDCGSGVLRCCCEFEWLPGRTTPSSVNLSLENEDASLNASIFPTTLNGVEPGVVETFTICVDADHDLLDALDVVIRPNVTAVDPGLASAISEVGRARLVYRLRCTPDAGDVVGSPTLDLASEECGIEPPPEECCCEFEWLPPPDVFGEVELTAVDVTSGLEVTIEPSMLLSVDALPPVFTICVDGPLGTNVGFTLVATWFPDGPVEVGRMRFDYSDGCAPLVTDIPDFASLRLTSEDCGVQPLQCCCRITWRTNDPEFGTETLVASLENADSSLQPATVEPPSFIVINDTITTLQVCVNRGHITLAAADLVIRGAISQQEYARLPLEFDLCVPIGGDPTGGGLWNILCGGPD